MNIFSVLSLRAGAFLDMDILPTAQFANRRPIFGIIFFHRLAEKVVKIVKAKNGIKTENSVNLLGKIKRNINNNKKCESTHNHNNYKMVK